MRKNSEEMVDHLWFHCSMARELWPFAFALFEVSLVMPKTVDQILASWQGRFPMHRGVRAWKATPLFSYWTIS